MAQPFSLGLNGAVDLWHPFPFRFYGNKLILSPSSRGLCSISLVTNLNALDGGCLMVSNIGAPTQEDFSLSLNISSIDTVEGKKNIAFRGI